MWRGGGEENPKSRVCTGCQKTRSIVRCAIRTKPKFRFKTNSHPPKALLSTLLCGQTLHGLVCSCRGADPRAEARARWVRRGGSAY